MNLISAIRESVVRAFGRNRFVLVVVTLYCTIHLGLSLTYDMSNPEMFLSGDRSYNRMTQIERINACENLPQLYQAIFAYGVPGDYLWQGLLFRLLAWFTHRQIAVVIFQIGLAALSIVYLARLTRLLTNDIRIVNWAILAYALLPNTFCFPHILVSEAFFVPMVIFATYHSIKFLLTGAWRNGIASSVLWGLSALTRPNIILFPLVLFLLYSVRRPMARLQNAGFLLGFSIVILMWVAPSYMETHQINLSNGDREMFGRTLHKKAGYVVSLLQEGEKKREESLLSSIDPAKFSSTDLAMMYLRHPIICAKVTGIEASKLLLKFNETKILNYFGLWKAEPDWGLRFAQDPLGYLKNDPLVTLLVAIGSLLWISVLLLSLIGAAPMFRENRDVGILLLVYAAYSLLTVLAVDFAQARHRYPVDFVIVLFAGFGALQLPLTWNELKKQLKRKGATEVQVGSFTPVRPARQLQNYPYSSKGQEIMTEKVEVFNVATKEKEIVIKQTALTADNPTESASHVLPAEELVLRDP